MREQRHSRLARNDSPKLCLRNQSPAEEHVLALERAGADDYRYLVHATRAQRIDDVRCFVGEHPGCAAEQCV